MHRMHALPPSFRPGDLVLLTILGTARGGRTSAQEIVDVAKEIAPDEWQPTGDVIVAGIATSLNARLLRRIESSISDSPVLLEITDIGCRVLRELLHRSLPANRGSFARACVAAKLCFLDDLDPVERSVELERLATQYRSCLESLNRRSDAPLAEALVAWRGRSKRWLDHEVERLEWELVWLGRLRSSIELEQATQ